MAQFNPKEAVYYYRDGKPAYYSYDEELYCGTFPEEWAENHLLGTGPKECGNCALYGSWNGVFLGYCANCADYEYNGERGRGFIDCGREDEAEEVKHFPSAFDTYLKDVSLDDVGDKDFMDSAKMLLIEEANAYIEACEWEEPDSEDESVEVGWCIDRCGGGYGSNFNGGYDSY